MRQAVRDAQRLGKRVAVVPTMGALHAGHLSLVERAQHIADQTVVTIFVNPTQFGPGEDLARYPRQLEQDLAQLARHDVDIAFAPPEPAIYPAGFSTTVVPGITARRWEGEFRPHHFGGVATIVLKLFHIVPADVALFGRKDFQQVQVVRQMVRDLNMPIAIEVAPTVREPDGLALSSRNTYLSTTGRQTAATIPRALHQTLCDYANGTRDATQLLTRLRQKLNEAEIVRIDYLAAVDPDMLEPVLEADDQTVLLLAVHVEETRLIDNVTFGDTELLASYQ